MLTLNPFFPSCRAQGWEELSLQHSSLQKETNQNPPPTNLPHCQNHPDLLPWGFCSSWVVPLQMVCPNRSVDRLSSLKNRQYLAENTHFLPSLPLSFRKFKGEIFCFGEGNILIIRRAGWFSLNWREKGRKIQIYYLFSEEIRLFPAVVFCFFELDYFQTYISWNTAATSLTNWVMHHEELKFMAT